MVVVRCLEVREYLGGLGSGSVTAPPAAELWQTLLGHGAVTGSPESGRLTEVGRHVLTELQARSPRADPRPLMEVASQIDRVTRDLDSVAHTAAYFLADLGPVVPAAAVLQLKPLAVGLASRRETPEQLAEEFRAAWGGVEVMGGDPRDRIVAAALLHAADLPMERVYAPLMVNQERIREHGDPRSHAITAATILELVAPGRSTAAVDRYLGFRKELGSDEGSAFLAALDDPDGARASVESVRSAFGPAADQADALRAALYLVVSGRPDTVEPVRAIASALGSRFVRPLLPAAMLSDHTGLGPVELVRWFDQATEIARAHQLAPTDAELRALALGLVHGIPGTDLVYPGEPNPPVASKVQGLLGLVAMHRWAYAPVAGAPPGTAGQVARPPTPVS